jgi:hypothetical protein
MFKFFFFEFGSIEIQDYDSFNNKVCISFYAPILFLQNFSPIYLAYGKIDGLRVDPPIHIWCPKFDDSIFPENIKSEYPDISTITNSHVRTGMENLVKIYEDVFRVCVDPSLLSFILPLGTYVKWNFFLDMKKSKSFMIDMERHCPIYGNDMIDSLAKCIASIK